MDLEGLIGSENSGASKSQHPPSRFISHINRNGTSNALMNPFTPSNISSSSTHVYNDSVHKTTKLLALLLPRSRPSCCAEERDETHCSLVGQQCDRLSSGCWLDTGLLDQKYGYRYGITMDILLRCEASGLLTGRVKASPAPDPGSASLQRPCNCTADRYV